MEPERRLGRFAALDERPVNLDGFTHENPKEGLVAMGGPDDPEPSLVVDDGVVSELDGKAAADFDLIDGYIAAHGLDLGIAPEAMAMGDLELARLAVDSSSPRQQLAGLVAGLTPAKLARVVALLRPVELQMALAKMRVRRTPSIQGHVTNRLDDPLLLAADAATAVALGFRELETTVPVLAHAPSNALALLVGSQVAAAGALTQCSIEEALELELGLRGLTTYAETVSVYGTEEVFIDGDDTPWSKAFLCSAYASRGLKMRVTSGAGAEVLMGAAEGKSMLYLESRCVSLARAVGSQGVQNGGIDGVSAVASVPGGMRELLAENLMVMMRDLESCSGNDTMVSESDIRRTAHTMPIFFAGSDYIFSGYGSIPRYDNTFAISNFNGEDLDDYLVLQRDWDIDGGLTPRDEDTLAGHRERAARATQAVYQALGLADFGDERIVPVVDARDSRDLPARDGHAVLEAANAIRSRQITIVDVVKALADTGFAEEAERVLALGKARLDGDYLQPAAIFDEEMRVLSAVTDPNDYRGPGTGYELDAARRKQLAGIRQQRSFAELLEVQAEHAGHVTLVTVRDAMQGDDPREVCIGVSPAFAEQIWLTLAGIPVGEALRQIAAGLEEEGCASRMVRIRSAFDVGRIGLTAARLAGSGIGIGLQAKGTALIHRRDLAPLANLELYSVAPQVTLEMYRKLGVNAGRHAKGMTPVPVFAAGTEESITARYHTQTIALVAVEREAMQAGAAPVDVVTRR